MYVVLLLAPMGENVTLSVERYTLYEATPAPTLPGTSQVSASRQLLVDLIDTSTISMLSGIPGAAVLAVKSAEPKLE